MKKKIISLMLAVTMLLCVASMPASAAEIGDFTDVDSSAWYYDAVNYAVSNGLFSGTSATTFSPNTTMTRGMFVTVLGHKAELPGWYGSAMPPVFTDVTLDDYFYPYAMWAYDNNIVAGVGNNRYNPGGEITREQMATILFNYAKHAHYKLTISSEKFDSYPDSPNVSAYAADPMMWAVSHEIIVGIEGKLMPQGMATRAQVAPILKNFSEIGSGTDVSAPPPTPPPAPTPTPDTEIPNPNPSENYNPVYTIPTGKSAVDEDGGYWDYDLANEIMAQIDELRVENNLNPLKYNPKMQGWASIRAKEHSTIHSHPDTAHVRPDGSHWSTVGRGLNAENLVWGNYYSEYYKEHKDEYAARMIQSWYNSDGHRNSMLESTFYLGAVSCYVKDNYTYIAHLFSVRSLYYMDVLIEQ